MSHRDAASLWSVARSNDDEGQPHDLPVQIEDAAHRLIQSIDFTSGSRFHVAQYEPAVYLQDHWVLNTQVGVDYGIRLETQTITRHRTDGWAQRFCLEAWKKQENNRPGWDWYFLRQRAAGIYAIRSYSERIVIFFDFFGHVIGSPVHYINLIAQAGKSNFPFIDRAQARWQPRSI